MNDFEIKYSFGNTVVSVVSPIEIKHGENLEKFVTKESVSSDFFIRVSPLPSTEVCKRISPVPVERLGNCVTLYLHENDVSGLSTGNLLSLAGATFLFIEKGAFVLHASFIIYKGVAVLFSAPSGTGKSTHASFWEERLGAEIINGDRALIYKEEGKFFASGVYTHGSSGICKNKKALLGAIVLLERGEKDEVFEISPREYMKRVIGEASYDVKSPSLCLEITKLAAELLSEVKVLCYRCRHSSDSAVFLENYLWEKKKL